MSFVIREFYTVLPLATPAILNELIKRVHILERLTFLDKVWRTEDTILELLTKHIAQSCQHISSWKIYHSL